MICTASEYLDHRQRAWLDAELLGRVKYDAGTRTVRITDVDVARTLTDALNTPEPRR